MNKPEILYEGQYTRQELDELIKQPIWKQKDIYTSQVKELFEITHADLIGKQKFNEKLNEYLKEKSEPDYDLRGNYVYYPWSGLLLHMVGRDELNLLRTNRTNNLITKEEQLTFGNFSAGIAGLSFGNGIALSLVYSGAANVIKIADQDIFETTNLNRVRVGLPSVNEPKTTVTVQEIYEINPYAEVAVLENGLNESNLDDFIGGETKLSIIYDVVDDFAMKIRLRLAAREAGIPVVMLTSLEDSILVDVERFDLDQNAEIFHGLLGGVADEILSKDISEAEKVSYAMKIVGPEKISYRNLYSLSEIGTSLVSRPHLYGTVSIVCGIASYVAKRIALGEDMPSMRKLLQFNELLGILPNKDDTPEARQSMLAKLMSSEKH